MKSQNVQEQPQQPQAKKEWYLISKHFKEYRFNYVWQSMAAGVFTFLMIFVFAELIALIILASVGSTFFAVFALPSYRTAQARNVLGSYVICISIGLACSYISSASLSGGIAVGAAAFGMVVTDTEHPPAAGVALGLALSTAMDQALAGALFAMIGALFSSLLRQAFRPWLKDLV